MYIGMEVICVTETEVPTDNNLNRFIILVDENRIAIRVVFNTLFDCPPASPGSGTAVCKSPGRVCEYNYKTKVDEPDVSCDAFDFCICKEGFWECSTEVDECV